MPRFELLLPLQQHARFERIAFGRPPRSFFRRRLRQSSNFEPYSGDVLARRTGRRVHIFRLRPVAGSGQHALPTRGYNAANSPNDRMAFAVSGGHLRDAQDLRPAAAK
jgi:hypothetical protein